MPQLRNDRREVRLFTDTMWPPTLEQVKTYFTRKGMNHREAEHFFRFYQLKQWRNTKGALITKWKNAALVWITQAGKA